MAAPTADWGPKRRPGAGQPMLYGVGVTVGAGLYVLARAVAGAIGVWAPLAPVLAGLLVPPAVLSAVARVASFLA